MRKENFKDSKDWDEYKKTMEIFYDEMLIDFMTEQGAYWGFLTEEEYFEIHKAGDGIEDLYKLEENWQPQWRNEHIFKSSFDAKKRIIEKLLDTISKKGLQEV